MVSFAYFSGTAFAPLNLAAPKTIQNSSFGPNSPRRPSRYGSMVKVLKGGWAARKAWHDAQKRMPDFPAMSATRRMAISGSCDQSIVSGGGHVPESSSVDTSPSPLVVATPWWLWTPRLATLSTIALNTLRTAPIVDRLCCQPLVSRQHGLWWLKEQKENEKWVSMPRAGLADPCFKLETSCSDANWRKHPPKTRLSGD